MTNIVTRYELEKQREILRNHLANYIAECANARIAIIKDSSLEDVLLSIKGEISMAAMEGRVDLVRSLTDKYEELACVEVDLQVIKEQEYEDSFGSKPQ